MNSYKDMKKTIVVSDSTLSFIAFIPVSVATDSVGVYIMEGDKSIYPVFNILSLLDW